MLGDLCELLFPPACVGCDILGVALCDRCFASCKPRSRALPTLAVMALGAYEGVLRRAVLGLKDGRRDVAAALAQRLARIIPAHSVLVPVPTTRARRRVRGLDGVSSIAAAIARDVCAASCDMLEVRANGAQRGRNRVQRLASGDRFRVVLREMTQTEVILIDDVVTTGATLEDCARAIRRAGGIVSRAYAVAVVPDERRSKG